MPQRPKVTNFITKLPTFLCCYQLYYDPTAVNSYIFSMVLLWVLASLLDNYALEPFIKWLQMGGWPTWWLWLLETTASIPSYVFGDESPPAILSGWGLENYPTIKGIMSLMILGIGLTAFIGFPFALMIACILTFFFAIAAGIQLIIGWIWPVLVVLAILAVIGKLAPGTNKDS